MFWSPQQQNLTGVLMQTAIGPWPALISGGLFFMDLADVWANYLKRRADVEAPSWFHSLTGAQVASQAGFAAMIGAINASGAASGASASAAAGAAAGAAGGGASGAG